MRISSPSWAPWALDTEDYTLVWMGGEEIADYPIDLRQCLDPANMLDWIFQATGRWGHGPDGARIVLGLLRALEDLLNPQAHLCSFGKARSITAARMRQLVDAHVASRSDLRPLTRGDQ